MINFIDSDNNASGITSDTDFLNHPGFIGGTWWKDLWYPKKAEEERYDKKYSDMKSKCPYSGGDSCADLDDAYWCYQDIKDASSGSHRTDNRARRAAETRMSDVNKLMEARDCDGRTSGVDSAQERESEAVAELKAEKEAFKAEIQLIQEQTQLQFLQLQQQQMQKAEEFDKSKKNIMLMAGGAVALTLLVVMIK